MKRVFLISLTSFLLISLASAAISQTKGYRYRKPDPYYQRKGIDDTLTFKIGIFLPSLDTNIRLDSEQYGTGTDISFEDDLFMDTSMAVFRVDGHLRLARHFRIEFGYYSINRHTVTVINKEIQFGDEIFTAFADVEATFDTAILKGALAISLINDGTTEFGLSIGSNIMFADVALDSHTANISESESEVVPVPYVGAFFEYTIMPRLFLSFNVQYFTLALEGIDGTMWDLKMAVEFYPIKNAGIGAGYSLFDLTVDVDTGDDISGKFGYNFSGIQLYATLSI